MISGTITDASGRTLSGQTTEAFWNSVAHARPLSVGLNCALGAQALRQYVQELSRVAPVFVSAHPNAGPAERIRAVRRDARVHGRRAPGVRRARAGQLRGRLLRHHPGAHPGDRRRGARPGAAAAAHAASRVCRLSGLEPLTIGPDSIFVNVGERTNVTGSRKFARLILGRGLRGGPRDRAPAGGERRADDRRQHGRGDARLPGGHGEVPPAHRLRARTSAGCRWCIDSSKWSVIEAGLKCVQGKGVVNSISLKEGEEEFIRQATLVRRYGAAVIVMAFDEQGQADTRRAQGRDLHPLLPDPDRAGRLPARGHHLRSEHLRHRHRDRGAQQLRAWTTSRPPAGSRRSCRTCS